ncbi:hypothetical protein C7B09_21610 [Escherichia albertii]|uniref:Uncharacterized protein n=1 Tax=Escherichia albertii TaxID=208962 RepID=A0ABX5HCF0_ESCAL|nr:hypothetical protein C7B09_21610 [Escherichia albertii]
MLVIADKSSISSDNCTSFSILFEMCSRCSFSVSMVFVILKWHTEFGHLNRGDMLTSEQHRCSNEKKKF